MTKRIALRLPEVLVDFVDGLVLSGTERSRSSAVAKALERERRRVLGAKDAEILARERSDHDLDEFAEYVAHAAVDLKCTHDR